MRTLKLLQQILHRCLTTPSSSSIDLRPYQEHCLKTCLDALAAGHSRLGISLPTGSGKTAVFISLLSRIQAPSTNPKAHKSLIIVNSIELARQSASQVAALFPHWSIEIEQGAKHIATGNADVTVATYQTLLSDDRLKKFSPFELKAIIVDEAHHAAAPSYRRILSRFDTNIKCPDKGDTSTTPAYNIPIIGFSATFGRHDGLALDSVFERIVYHRDLREMIKESWLCPVRLTTVRADINLKDVTVNSQTGDFNTRSLARVINTDTINHLVVKSWLDKAADRKSTLVFCVNIAHITALTETFRSHGIDAHYVYSGTPVQERKALIASFEAGQFPVLVNCAILTEGADIQNIDCVVLARPTRSRNVLTQMIGRGMRLSPRTGKEDCHIIDFVDNTSQVSDVICVPTLLGTEPSGQRARVVHPRGAVNLTDTTDTLQPRSISYIDHKDLFSQLDQYSGAPHVSALSKFAWVGCGNNVYVLPCFDEGSIRIDPVKTVEGETQYLANFLPALARVTTTKELGTTPYKTSRTVLTADKLDDAIRGCDAYVTKIMPRSLVRNLKRSAKWRNAPATDGQKAFLIHRGWFKPGSADADEINMEEMTRGEATNGPISVGSRMPDVKC